MTTALVTGANRGIGLELTRLLKERGDEVIAVCRTPSPELKALDVLVQPGIDVTSDASIRALAENLSGTRLDVLIHNAGILKRNSLQDLDVASVREQFEVNALGPLRLTAALLPLLRDGARIALITSRMGSIGDNSSGGSYGYRMSKAALNMMGMSLARDLADRGIVVAILHPGMVRTSMTSNRGNWDAPEAAAALLQRLDEAKPETSGTFWHANGEVLPWVSVSPS